MLIMENNQMVNYDNQCSLIANHEINVRDLGQWNEYREVNRSWCKFPPSKQRAIQHHSEADSLTMNNTRYTTKKHHNTVYMRCSNCSFVGDVGLIYITGSNDVFCGPIEFDVTVTGNNNKIYRVVSCLLLLAIHNIDAMVHSCNHSDTPSIASEHVVVPKEQVVRTSSE
jgi:hypothetical protein